MARKLDKAEREKTKADREALLWGIGRRVADIRLARSWSQEKLSEKTLLGASYIAHIEIGSRQASLSVLLRIATALEVPLWRLMTDDRLTPDESARESGAKELAEAAHGLSADDLRSLAYVATRMRGQPSAAPATSAHKRLPARRR